MPRTIDDYLNLPYHLVLVEDEDEDGRRGWVAEVSEFPGCMSQGTTADEAVQRVRDAMQGWISVALDDGREIPLPRETSSFSGRFLVRVPRSLHAELSRAAEEEGVSLNQFINDALSGAVNWRSPAREYALV